MTGKFIVIEGLDATGKSTLVGELAKSLCVGNSEKKRKIQWKQSVI